MKIEFGFQANCSEMMTYLCPLTLEDVHSAMLRIKELFGGTWRSNIKVGSDKYYILMPDEKIPELIMIDMGKHGQGLCIDQRKLGDLWEGELPAEVRKWFREHRIIPGMDYEIPMLTTISSEEPIAVNVERPIAITDGFCPIFGETYRDGFYFMISDLDEWSLPEFHRLRNAFGSRYSSYGTGGTRRYDEWMFMHFTRFGKEETKELMRSYHNYPKVDTDLERRMDSLWGCPPYPDSGVNDPYDIDDIIRTFIEAKAREERKKGKKPRIIRLKKMEPRHRDLLESHVFDVHTTVPYEMIRKEVFAWGD